MDRKNILLITSIIILIICVGFGIINNKKDVIKNSEMQNVDVNINYNTIIDNNTGKTYYQLYDENSGEIIRDVTDKSAIQMYIDNPDFVGTQVESEFDTNENGEITSVWDENNN